MSKHQLRVVSGAQSGTLIPLPGGRFIIGREHDCHLRPNSELISRHHCVFTTDSQGIRLRDLGSTNGTFLNGERVQGTALLKAGDRVTAGKVDLIVVIDGQPSISSEETVLAQSGDTVTLGRRGASVPVASESDFDISQLADVMSELEDEATQLAPATVVATPAEAPAVAASATDTQVFTVADPVAGAATHSAVAANSWAAVPPGAYPPGYPQYPPGYPPMPYGYGYPYPGMPAPMPPGYGYPAPAAPVAAEPEPAAKTSAFPEIRLPDPSETGAKAPEPKPSAAATAGGAPTAHIPTAAKDIINTYLNRRPKT